MNTQKLENNCKTRLIHGLGSVHEWQTDTYGTIEDFRKELSRLIKPDYNSLSSYIGAQQEYYITISHSPSQPNETRWLKELGFKQLKMGDGLVLSSMDYFTWQQLR
jgi:hypothetical protein